MISKKALCPAIVDRVEHLKGQHQVSNKAEYHRAFRFQLSFLRFFGGQVGTALPHTYSPSTHKLFWLLTLNIHIVHYHILYMLK